MYKIKIIFFREVNTTKVLQINLYINFYKKNLYINFSL